MASDSLTQHLLSGVVDNEGPSDRSSDKLSSSSETSAGTGTLFSSVFMVLNSAVGTGILTLPYSFRAAGVAGGVLLLITFVVVEAATMMLLVQCTAAAKVRDYR